MIKRTKAISILLMLVSLASCEPIRFTFSKPSNNKNNTTNSSSSINTIDSIEITNPIDRLVLGHTYQLNTSTDKEIIWESGNTNIVSIDEEGVITGKKIGSTTIYASLAIDSSVSTEMNITVVNKTPTPTSSSSSSNNNSSSSSQTDSIENENPNPKKYKLNWHDEFDGNSLNMNYWSYQEGDGSQYGIPGWGNSEQQYYSQDNVSVNNGALKITARRENKGGKAYTSARIRTANKVAFTYGRIEAKIKLPPYQGLWPAFWMLPDTATYGNWPNSGEIDIMEAKGRLPNETSAAIHFANNNNQHAYITGTCDLNQTLSSNMKDWHTYAVEWESDSLFFYVDDICFFGSKCNQYSGVEGNSGQPFDKNFHILLNLAVGGMFDNYINPNDSDLPASMEVDYVRWWGLK